MANPFIRFKNRVLTSDEIVEILRKEFPDAKIYFNEQTVHRINRETGVMEKKAEKQILIDKNEQCGAALDIEDGLLYAKPRLVSKSGFFKSVFGGGNSERKEFCKTVLKTILNHT